MPPSPAASPIVAQAFRIMEVSPLSGFGDDSDEARATAEAYPIALRQCLEHADWSFASRLLHLSSASQPSLGGDDADLPWFYHLPPGLVRLHEVGDIDGSVRWRRDAEGVRADRPGPLRVRFTAMVETEASLPANFQTAVAYALALALGPRFLTSASKLETIERRWGEFLRLAAGQDTRHASPQRYDGLDEGGDWVTEARR